MTFNGYIAILLIRYGVYLIFRVALNPELWSYCSVGLSTSTIRLFKLRRQNRDSDALIQGFARGSNDCTPLIG